jgi:CCR4-NOT transcription complex subunit 1
VFQLLLCPINTISSAALLRDQSPTEGPLQERKDNNNNTSTDYNKIVLSQLAVLSTTIKQESFHLTVQKINHICNVQESPEVYIKYLRRLILTNSSLIPTNVVHNPSIEALIETELSSLRKRSSGTHIFKSVLFKFDSDLLKFFTLNELFQHYHIDPFDQLILALSLNLDKSSDYFDQVKEVFDNSFNSVIKLVHSDQLDYKEVDTLLQLTCTSEVPSLFQLAITGTSTFEFISKISPDLISPESLEVFTKLLTKMKFEEFLQGLGPENIVPERLLSELLSVQTQDDLDDALALLFAEVIVPGSQNLAGTNQITNFTPSSIPEASARGSQFGSIIRKLPKYPNWDVVFSKVNSRLINPVISQASLSQLLSALDDKTIDAILEFDWSLNMKIQLFFALRQLNPRNGSFDILRTNYLKPIIQDPDFSNVKNSILFYSNVTRLELNCISQSSLIENIEFKKFLHQIFEDDIRTAPELIALGCVQYSPQSKTVDDLLENLIVHLLDESSHYYTLVLKHLKDKALLFSIITKLVSIKGTLHTNTISFLVKNNQVDEYLNNVDFDSGLLLAVQAVKVGWNNLEKFLAKHKSVDKILEFLSFQSDVNSEGKVENNRNTSLKAIYILLEFVQKQNLTETQFAEFQAVQTQTLQAFPRLINFGFGHDEAILGNGDSNSFPFDVEQQMKIFYQRMYNHEIEIKDVISMLQALRDSDQPRDQDVFACMIHSLLDEYRFFPEYPLNALAITSVLFGSMIFFQLIRGSALTIALRYILDSCNQAPESNMFKFAVQALYAFRQRLPEFPNYCSALTEIESLKSQPQIYQIILDAVNNKSGVTAGDIALNQAQQQQQLQTEERISQRTNVLKSINASIPLMNDVTQERPKPEVSKKISFLFNNLSDDNLDVKIKEVQNLLTPSIYEWFARFLVTQRVKQEPNNHYLYGPLVLSTNDELLVEHIVNVTVDEIDELLNGSDETPTQRSFLKALGSWLGMITLARNKPLKYINIALKELLVEAYDKSKLNLVIPFVARVLEKTSGSVVFRYPNPWTLGLLKVLVELYYHADLKLNFKFEIEVLFSNLKLNIEDIEPDTIIRNHDARELDLSLDAGLSNLKLEGSKSTAVFTQQQEFQPEALGLPNQSNQFQPKQSQQRVGTPVLGQQQQLHLQQQPLQQQQSRPQPPLNQLAEVAFRNLRGSSIFVTNEALRQIFGNSLAAAVRDILPPAVERAVSIAVTTSRSLILKDFATESDEAKLRNAAYTVVRRLADGLALATCRDPLKESIQSHVHSFAPQLVNVENSPLEELPLAINDNIDLACAVIEKAAMDKAVQEVEEVLTDAFSIRRLHKERRPDQPFFSPNLSRYSISLPEPLGLKPNGVTPQQYQVYENFGKHVVTSPSPANTILQQQDAPLGVNISQQPQSQPPQSQQLFNALAPQDLPQQAAKPIAQQPPQGVNTAFNQQQLSVEQTIALAQNLIESLIRTVGEQEKTSHFTELTQESPIRLLLGQTFNAIAKNLHKEPIVLKITQFIVNALFTTSESSLSVEVFVLLLDKICSISPTTRKDVVWWLLHGSDKRKFNEKVLLPLLNVRLIKSFEFDLPLAENISEDDPESVEFAISFIERCLRSKGFATYHSDFISSIEVLKSIKNNGKVTSFLASLKDIKPAFIFGDDDDTQEEISTVDNFGYVFSEWIRLLQHKPNNSKLHYIFIKQLFESGVLNETETFTLFFRSSVELSITYFKEADNVNDGFLATDALSKLIVLLLKNQDELVEDKLNYFKLIMSIISLVFADDHTKSKEKFNERPYFRIFSTLLSEWVELGYPKDDEFNIQFYLILADFFNSYQPFAFPGFTFAWITLISHRLFLPFILELNHSKAKSKFVLLLLNLLRFESKYIRGKQIPEVISVIYKGTSRIFLLLLHDYPEILVENHHQLCCEIPASFVQLRNIVLSAFPKTVSMPDPFSQGLKVDRLPEISESPIVAYHPQNDLRSLKKSVDSYLRIPSQVLLKTVLNGLKQPLSDEAGIGYSKSNFSTKSINALVLYVGIQAVDERQGAAQSFNPKSSHYSLLSSLIQEGSVEFQYHLIEAICNQLRFPNAHTYWFSYLVLHFFGAQTLWNGKKSQVQQIITRVLLERIICNRPHPWGLLITFTELLKNSELAFFELPFIKSSPEVEKIFESLLRHISSSSSSNRPSSQIPNSSGAPEAVPTAVW